MRDWERQAESPRCPRGHERETETERENMLSPILHSERTRKENGPRQPEGPLQALGHQGCFSPTRSSSRNQAPLTQNPGKACSLFSVVSPVQSVLPSLDFLSIQVWCRMLQGSETCKTQCLLSKNGGPASGIQHRAQTMIEAADFKSTEGLVP